MAANAVGDRRRVSVGRGEAVKFLLLGRKNNGCAIQTEHILFFYPMQNNEYDVTVARLPDACALLFYWKKMKLAPFFALILALPAHVMPKEGGQGGESKEWIIRRSRHV